MTSLRKRYPEIDLIRTFAIVGMIAYHTLFMSWFFFQLGESPLHGWKWLLARTTSNTFLLLVGMSFVLASQGKNKEVDVWQRAFKRGGIVLGAAMLVTIGTYIFMPDLYIQFGILHCIGVSMILLPAFRWLKEWNAIVGGIFIIIGRAMESMYVSSTLFLPFGLKTFEFRTLDYFPLLPYFGVVLIGFSLGHLLFERLKLEPQLKEKPLRWITWPGRHSLPIYLIHPLVIYGILKLMS